MDWQFKVGLGVAILFGLLPFAVKDMPHWITWPGLTVGGLLVLWGVLPRHDEFAILPTVLFVTFCAGAAVCAAWAYDVLPTGHVGMEPPLFVDWAFVGYPVKVPDDGRLFIVDIGGLTNLGGFAEISAPPGTEYNFTGSAISTKYRYTIINDGPHPIAADFSLSIAFREVDKNKSGTGLVSGAVLRKVEWPLPISRIESGSNNPFVFYIYNYSEDFVDVQFPEKSTVRDLISGRSSAVNLNLSLGKRSFGFFPISLNNKAAPKAMAPK